jgi:hypothetical protein
MAKKLSIGGTPPVIETTSEWGSFFNVATRLKELRVFYEAGEVLALYDALQLVGISKVRAPAWVIKGAISIIGPQLKAGISTGKGASANTAAKYQNEMMHFRRWLVVRNLREKGEQGGLYEKAEKELQGNFAHGSAAVIGKSFRRVESHLKTPKTALRYYRGYMSAALLGIEFPGDYWVKPSVVP